MFHVISIHALREESDTFRSDFKRSVKLFQSTPSARRATVNQLKQALTNTISIHALREESDVLTQIFANI